MKFLDFHRFMSRVIGQFYVYMWCLCWVIGNWLPCYRPGQAALTQTHGCPLCSYTSLTWLFFRQEFFRRSMTVLLNFKQYLKPNRIPVTWTVCSLPCRATVCGNHFAKHRIQAQEVASMTLMMWGSANQAQSLTSSSLAEQLCGCGHSSQGPGLKGEPWEERLCVAWSDSDLFTFDQ